MNGIFKIEELNELEISLKSQNDIDRLRDSLFTEFLKYADYKNVKEWDNAVRVCEGLVIIGWGSNEVLEALKDSFFNGNPMACLVNKHREPRFAEAIWSGRVNGFTIEAGRTSYRFSPDDPSQGQSIAWEYKTKEDVQGIELRDRRSWIPKSPIQIKRIIGNCYGNSKVVIESIENDL